MAEVKWVGLPEELVELEEEDTDQDTPDEYNRQEHVDNQSPEDKE